MSGKTYHRILSAVACVSLLLNSLWGVFLYPQVTLAVEPEEPTKYIEFIEPSTGTYGGDTTSLNLVVEAEYEPYGIDWIMFRYAPPGESCQQQYTPPYFNRIEVAEHEEDTDVYTQTWDISGLESGEYTLCALMHKNGGSEGYVEENLATVQAIIDYDAPLVPTGLHIIQDERDLGCESYINQRRITVDWDDNTEPDFDHYDYQIREERTIAQPVVSEYTGDIRDEDGYYKYRVRAVDTAGNASGWADWCGVTLDRVAPSSLTIISPPNDSYLKTENLTKIDWTDVDDPSSPVTYQYQAFSDEDYTINRWGPSSWLSVSEIPTPGTPEGVYYVRVRAKDAASNISDWSNGEDSPHKITVDNTPPTLPGQMGWTTENPPEGEDYVGGSDFDNYKTCGQSLNYSPMTNFWQPSTDNTGVIGYEREVYSPEETRIYSTTLSTNYQNGGGAIDGTTYWVRARAFDAVGNFSSWTEKCAITYDESPPVTILTSPEDNTYWNEPIIVQGSSVDNVGVNSVNLSYQPIEDEIWFLIKTLANELGSPSFNWTYPWQPSEEGIYNIKASAEDTAGNVEESAHANNITYDITAPDTPENLGFNVPPGDYSEPRPETDVACGEYTNENQISHHWTDESESGAVLYQRQWQYPGGSTWHGAEEWQTPYTNYRSFGGGEGAEGLWRVRVRVRDLADNWSEWSEACTVIYDNTSPNSFFTSPSGGRIFGGPEEEPIYIAGHSTDELVETVDYTEIHYRVSEPEDEWQLLETFVNEGGNEPFYWETYWKPEKDGIYDFRAIATDKAGNVEETAYVYGVIYDTTDPELSWTKPAEDTIISGTTIILSVATDNLSGVDSVTYYYQREGEVDWHKIATLTSSPPYETSWDTTGLALDDYNLKAVAMDKAGNSVEAIRSVSVAAVISGETWSRPEFGKITVNWTTDRSTSGRVVYDTTSHSIDLNHPNYGYANTSGVVDNSPKTTSHTVTLSELLNGITYYWRTVSSGSPVVISEEHRGDTFSIPGPPGDGGGGAVAGLTTDTIATTTSFVTGEVEEISVSEEEEVLGEETATITQPEELEGVGESVLAKSKVIRVILWGGAALGGLILIYYFFFKRRKKR